MAFCGKCGQEIEHGAKFCGSCGAAVYTEKTDYAAKIKELNNTADTTREFDEADIKENKIFAIMAYLGILVLIPFFAEKESAFARYHTNQGLVLVASELAFSVLLGILRGILFLISWELYVISGFLSIVNIVFVVLAVLGILNVVNGRAKELPIIGKIRLIS